MQLSDKAPARNQGSIPVGDFFVLRLSHVDYYIFHIIKLDHEDHLLVNTFKQYTIF